MAADALSIGNGHTASPEAAPNNECAPHRGGGPRGNRQCFWPRVGSPPVEWIVSAGPVAYLDAVAAMEAHVALIADRRGPERVWLLEHPPLYTAGTSARDSDLVSARLPVHRTGRGGQYTYHGPGQRVLYVMLDLQRRRPDVRAFVAALEDWAIAALEQLDIVAERREDRVGVWVKRPEKPRGPDGTPAEDKIAAIGVRLRRWVSYHGIAINVEPDLSHYAGIVPCGVRTAQFGVTSMADLSRFATFPEVDGVMRREFERIFGPTLDASARI